MCKTTSMLLKHAHLKFKGTLCIINYVFSQTKTHKMNGRSTRISMQNVQQKQAKESPKKRHILNLLNGMCHRALAPAVVETYMMGFSKIKVRKTYRHQIKQAVATSSYLGNKHDRFQQIIYILSFKSTDLSNQKEMDEC